MAYDLLVGVARQEVRLENSVAVLLNARARGVTPRVVSSIEQHLPPESVFVSSTLDEAEEYTREIMSRGYHKVLTGGGDGTLMSFLNHSLSYSDDEGEYPLIGVLKLGTGNGIGEYIGAESYLSDLRQMTGTTLSRRQRISLVEVDGTFCPFAGFGLDAAILNDYKGVKDTWAGQRFRYALSVPTLSIPKQMTFRRQYPLATVVNVGATAYRIGEDGQPTGQPIEAGETIYRGPAQLLSAGTTPYYGYGFKMFPYVERRPGKMQLRISKITTAETLAHLPAIWRGTHRSKNILDFWVESAHVVFDEDLPFQIGGDAAGNRRDVTFTLSEKTVDLIDLSTRNSPRLAN